MPPRKKTEKTTVRKPLILRDTSEHKGHGWLFEPDGRFAGTESRNLYTGDYSLDGYYDNKVFVIERKGSVSEFVRNISHGETWADFRDELERLEEFAHPYIVCEFPYSLLETFPIGSNIPRRLWPSLRVTSQFLVRRFWEIQLTFKTKIHFANAGGKSVALQIFKRMVERYDEEGKRRPGSPF